MSSALVANKETIIIIIIIIIIVVGLKCGDHLAPTNVEKLKDILQSLWNVLVRYLYKVPRINM